jgi:hypothetical protein
MPLFAVFPDKSTVPLITQLPCTSQVTGVLAALGMNVTVTLVGILTDVYW